MKIPNEIFHRSVRNKGFLGITFWRASEEQIRETLLAFSPKLRKGEGAGERERRVILSARISSLEEGTGLGIVKKRLWKLFPLQKKKAPPLRFGETPHLQWGSMKLH